MSEDKGYTDITEMENPSLLKDYYWLLSYHLETL